MDTYQPQSGVAQEAYDVVRISLADVELDERALHEDLVDEAQLVAGSAEDLQLGALDVELSSRGPGRSSSR